MKTLEGIQSPRNSTRSPKKIKSKEALPSTSDVNKVTFAALRLPAGRFNPIFSSLSLKHLPPFLDFALEEKSREVEQLYKSYKENYKNGAGQHFVENW